MFKIYELVKASQGKLISGDDQTVVKGISIDSRKINKGEAFLAIRGDNFDGHDFIKTAIARGARCIISEKELRGIGAALIKVKDSTKALGAVARYNRKRYDIPVITVTGSNGKTTTKDMISQVLSKEFKVLSNEGTKNNHIGLALTLLKLDSSYDVAVLEIGTNHFGEVKYLSGIAAANIGVITNIGPSHLEHLKSLKGVFKEKRNLITGLKSPAIAILNADDKFLKGELLRKNSKVFSLGIGINNASDFRASLVSRASGKCRFTVNRRLEFALTVPGYYNIYNSLAAIAVGRIFGISYQKIASALSVFKLPSGRLNIIKKKGISFIDDTYNSNPLSLGQALDLLKEMRPKGRRIAVIGDMLELGKNSRIFHTESISQAAEFCDNIITVGSLSSLGLKDISLGREKIISCRNSSSARGILFKKIKVNSSDIVLVKGSRRMKMEEVFNF
ncbi:MAG: UDP-N-acetylmuramoyl-tripeptide--D-alanyl-D-alanine ligase [Candidatus Omnitrophica bacterium]|nr:UDP-N-acetylmuramoyl-tripeptide--D-alanyl-D-alanine ligase [Candidatus Omnitrophota bacterium]